MVCIESAVPPSVEARRGLRCLAVRGPLDFGETGVLDSLTDPLAADRISILALSTFATDYVLVSEEDLDLAVASLRAAGHRIRVD